MFLLVSVALLFAGNQLIYGADTCQDTAPCVGCFNCSLATADLCNDTGLGPTISQLCPLTCGVCVCADNSSLCTPEMCVTPGLEQVVKDSCQKTCNFCGPNATVATTAPQTTTPATLKSTSPFVCADQNPHCSSWAASGFCTEWLYITSGEVWTCAKTCGLCDTSSTQPANPYCFDKSPDCTNWNANHYCRDASLHDKQEYCEKTCGLC